MEQIVARQNRQEVTRRMEHCSTDPLCQGKREKREKRYRIRGRLGLMGVEDEVQQAVCRFFMNGLRVFTIAMEAIQKCNLSYTTPDTEYSHAIYRHRNIL